MPVHPVFALETIADIEGAVFGLAAQSHGQMVDPATRPLIPPLYGGRIRYQREPLRRERWQAALETARRGIGDCEDLAAYRVAELRIAGIDAYPVVDAVNPMLRHVRVRYVDPRTRREVFEDPSARLGMKGAG